MPDYRKLSPVERVQSYCYDISSIEKSISLLLFGEVEERFESRFDVLRCDASELLPIWDKNRFHGDKLFDALFKSYRVAAKPRSIVSFSFKFHDFAYVDIKSGKLDNGWIESPADAFLDSPADQGGDTYVGAITEDLSFFLCLGLYWDIVEGKQDMTQKFRASCYGSTSDTESIESFLNSDDSVILRHATGFAL